MNVKSYMEKSRRQYRLWIDLETTGLDPDKDEILEVGGFLEVINHDSFIELSPGFERVINPNKQLTMDPVVIKMHSENKLLSMLHSGFPLEHVEQNLIKIIDEFLEKRKDPDDDKVIKLILAGSSVHFDAGFLKRHMPKLAKKFSHKYLDVSAITLMWRELGFKVPEDDEMKHRALSDIQQSYTRYRNFTGYMKDLTGSTVDA